LTHFGAGGPEASGEVEGLRVEANSPMGLITSWVDKDEDEIKTTTSIGVEMIRESGCIRGASVLLIWRKREKRLPSDEHFTVNETLLGAWAGATSFQRKDGNSEPPEGNGSNLTLEVHGEKRSNATYESTTDGDARLTKKSAGKKANLSHAGHVLMENRNGLIGGWKIKPITPFGNSQYQADVTCSNFVESESRWLKMIFCG